MKWISVKSGLPDVNVNVLVHTGMKEDTYLIGKLNDMGWFWDDDANYLQIPVTHWAYLEPPDENS